jgi:hypothetical protein
MSSLAHNVKDFRDKIEGDIVVKKVAHRIDENCVRLLPMQRYFKGVRMRRNIETIDVIATARGFQTQSHTFGIAVLTAGANFCAAGNRIPSRFSPFDFGIPCHFVSIESIP